MTEATEDPAATPEAQTPTDEKPKGGRRKKKPTEKEANEPTEEERARIEMEALVEQLIKTPITSSQIDRMFTYHAPDEEQIEQIKRVRRAAKAFAQVIKDNTLGSADQSAALRKVREAAMTANAAIVLKGAV